jgi:ribose transport system substrate-binding protein
MREASYRAMSMYLRERKGGELTLVAAANDTSALGVLDAVREVGQEGNFAIVGQDCIPEVLEEMHRESSAIVGSISHEPETYGPRLIQLGISILRGYTVPPYNYVHHRAVSPETLGEIEKGKRTLEKTAAHAVAVG